MRAVRYLLTLISVSVTVLLTGCYSWYDYNSANNYGSRRDLPPQDTSRAYQTQQQYSPVSHKVTNLEMNQFLSDQVAAMDGVNSAIVLMGDTNAYVGITIDASASGTKGVSGVEGRTSETNHEGMVRGLYSPNTPLSDSDDPSQLISGNAGAETQKDHGHLSHLFKQKIAEKIRMLQPSVTDVYISANRNVVNEFNRLAQESWHGRSLEPYREHFTRLMEFTFGTNPTIPNQAESNGREY